MAEQPINSNEIIDPKFLDVAIQKAEEFLAIEKELEEQGKKNLLVQRERIAAFKGGSSNELKEQAKATAEATRELKNLEALKQAAAKTEQALANARAANERAQKAQIATEQAASKASQQATRDTQVATTAYDALRKKYNDLSRAQIELSVRGRENGVVFKSIKDEATKLRAALDQAEQGAGRFQRNVGNYASGFDGLGNSVSQLAREMPAFANSVQTGFMAISNNLPMFFDQLQKINKENENLIKQGKPTESVFSKLGSAIGSTSVLLSIGVTLLTVYGSKIVEVVSNLFSQNDALKLNEEALKAQKEAIDESIQGQKDLAAATAENNIEILNSTDKLTDTQAKNLRAYSKFEDQRLKILDRQKKAALKIAEEQADGEEIILNESGSNLIAKRTVFGKESLSINEAITRKALEENDIQYQRELKQLEFNLQSELEKIIESDGKQKKLREKKAKEIIDLNNRIIRLNIENESDTKQRAEQLAKDIERVTIEEINKLNATEKQKQMLILSVKQDTINKLIEIDDKYAKIEQDAIKEKYDKLLALKEKDINAAEKMVIDGKEYQLFLLEEQYQNEKKLGDKANKKKLEDLQNQILEEKKLLIQKRADNEKEGKTDLEKEAIQKKADIEKNKLRKDEIKDDRDKELKEALAFSTKVIDIIAKEEAKKSQLRVDAFDKSIKDQEKNIETQRKLAEKGAKNTLVEEEANKVKLERQKEIEKQQEIKRQKALAFFKLFASYADKDPNTALQKALRDTVIAEAISGAFIDGTENVERDLKGNKVHNGTDGYVIAVDGRERILNPDQNEKVGNLSNEALADLAYKHNNGLLESAKFGVMQSNSFADNIKNSALLMATMQTNKRLESLENAIKSRPISNFQFDGYGDFIKTTIEDGFKKTTRYKQNKPRI